MTSPPIKLIAVGICHRWKRKRDIVRFTPSNRSRLLLNAIDVPPLKVRQAAAYTASDLCAERRRQITQPRTKIGGTHLNLGLRDNP